jgi:hypothetical protein
MKIFASIAGIIGAAILTLTLSIDGIVKKSIEDSASELLKTEVKVSDVDISIFSGKGEIEGFAIINPEGFSNQVAIGFEEMSMKVNLRSLFSETVIVEELIVQNPEIYLEQKGSNANLKELSTNIETSSGEDDSSKKLVINYFLMEEGRATVSSEVKDLDGAEVSISRVELTGVGKESSNTVQQTMKQILEPIIKDVVKETVEGQILNKVENTVRDLIGN